jgi:hypothetical protein
LPKDFQQALDILFDGDTPKPAEMIAEEVKPPELPEPEPEPEVVIEDTDLPQMILPEELAQVGVYTGDYATALLQQEQAEREEQQKVRHRLAETLEIRQLFFTLLETTRTAKNCRRQCTFRGGTFAGEEERRVGRYGVVGHRPERFGRTVYVK